VEIIQGWEAQNALLVGQLDDLITRYETRRESLIIEARLPMSLQLCQFTYIYFFVFLLELMPSQGVHLSATVLTRLMEKHPSCIPFLVYISNKVRAPIYSGYEKKKKKKTERRIFVLLYSLLVQAKHKERFAVRAKYMTIDPRHNKYVKYIKNIRVISDYLCLTFDRHQVRASAASLCLCVICLCVQPLSQNGRFRRSTTRTSTGLLRRSIRSSSAASGGTCRRTSRSGTRARSRPSWCTRSSRSRPSTRVRSARPSPALCASFRSLTGGAAARMLRYLEMKAQQQAAKINEPEPSSDDDKEEGLDSQNQPDYFDEGSLGS
jgi:hypothetical protein